MTAVGEGEIKVKPDQALIRFQLVQRSVSAPTAEAAHRRQLTLFTLLLREHGAEAERIQVGPSTLTENPDAAAGLTWSVRSEVRLSLNDLTKAEALLAKALAEGATLQGIEYGLVSPEGQIQKGIDAALANARSRAERIAGGSGGNLGAPLSVEMLGTPVIEAVAPDLVRLKVSLKVTFPM